MNNFQKIVLMTSLCSLPTSAMAQTFSHKCDVIHNMTVNVKNALAGHWRFSGSINWSVSSTDYSPRYREYESQRCTASAYAESNLYISPKRDSINGGLSGTYSFNRPLPSIRVTDPISSNLSMKGWDTDCKPSASDRVPQNYNDGLIILKLNVVEEEGGYCKLYIDGEMGRNGDMTSYRFKLNNETTLTRESDGRVYRKVP